MGLSNNDAKEFALALLKAETESSVIQILKDHGFWGDPSVWRLYGDSPNNFSTIGNQQSRPEAALVEKIVNAVDARLMDACLSQGIDPAGASAPRSIQEAVAKFIEKRKDPQTGGRLVEWDDPQIRAEAKNITIAVTGATAGAGNASITIADFGEGQTPDRVPDTFLSIGKDNKLRIPFVQGKFNMGGTGVLMFCGQQRFQLLITRRNPALVGNRTNAAREADTDKWSVTIVRRELPEAGAGGVRSSVFRYLAPVGAEKAPERGGVLRFAASSLPLMPEKNSPYVREVTHGSAIKLFEYDMKGFRSHALMKGQLLAHLETLLPEIALPVRVHECRKYSGDENRSFENSLKGLAARLHEERKNLFEEGFPTSVQMTVQGQTMTVQIMALVGANAASYTNNDGVLFVINGQTHGALPRVFFERKKVGMQRLAGSLIVMVDCSAMSTEAREDLFKNSRDRLNNGALRKEIEDELEDIIGKHPALKDLRERRKSSEIKDRLEESKPLEDVLRSILKSSPSLSQLFLRGQRLNRPDRSGAEQKGAGAGGTEAGTGKFVGKTHPSFFRFRKSSEEAMLTRTAELGRRARVPLETDVANDYFKRAEVPGRYIVEVIDGALEGKEIATHITLYNGLANWVINIPEDGIAVGDELTLQLSVTDDTLIEPFVNVLRLKVVPKSETTSGPPSDREESSGTENGKRGGKGSGKGNKAGAGDSKEVQGGIELPNSVEVHRGDAIWSEHGFDERTACLVIDDGSEEEGQPPSFTFYINVDNVYLLSDLKGSQADAAVQKAKFKYANILVGLALIHDARQPRQPRDVKNGSGDADDGESFSDTIRRTTRALAPFLIPMIDFLGSLEEEQLKSFSKVGDSDE